MSDDIDMKQSSTIATIAVNNLVVSSFEDKKGQEEEAKGKQTHSMSGLKLRRSLVLSFPFFSRGTKEKHTSHTCSLSG